MALSTIDEATDAQFEAFCQAVEERKMRRKKVSIHCVDVLLIMCLLTGGQTCSRQLASGLSGGKQAAKG